ncbi:2-hydroxyacid dehydrogenase [Elstera cyanobacteriorum]|uniref:2-hydroxyacid dehydrogenase n=1 Tax=Elstera cyanobacteriorum TaxID=2022747 RepID=UPI002352EBCD|nr:glyoxylate/hydroxypyruvate reductase A [Elstera cyanobacteriorum]MCK6441983.1 glyoxylate/hydroxypyruvate reductase A [Elstera cyanobacteriorum]
MTLLLATPGAAEPWLKILRAEAPDRAVHLWGQTDAQTLATIPYALVWKPPADLFAPLTGLKAIFNLGAGVDALLAHPGLPKHVPLVRIVDGGMAAQMAEYALYGVLHVHRRFDLLAQQQAASVWNDPGICDPAETRVGILGLGALAQGVIEKLQPFGFPLSGWSRSPRSVPGVTTYAGLDSLPAFLAGCDVLIVLLPLTAETEGLLSDARLAHLPPGASVINLARGALIDEAALLARLDSGAIRFALLDVFRQEPLPTDHPFWRHPRVKVTPHTSAATLPREAIQQILGNIAAFERGAPMQGVIDPTRGY